jgi:hypothetical protein
MPRQKPKRAKPAQTPPPPSSMAELLETARRMQARSQETIRQLAALREEIRSARAGQDQRKQT